MSVPFTAAAAAPVRARTTLWLLAALAATTVAVGWFTNEYVITRDFYHRILDARLDASRVDAQFDFVQQVAIWGYLTTPIVLLIRLAIVAMTVQLFLLLATDVPFRVVFRAACWAYLAMFAGAATKAAYLFVLPDEAISVGALHGMPSSLASVLMYPEDYKRPLYSLLSLVNVFEIAWCVILYQVLRSRNRVAVRPAALATIGTWTLLSTLQWAFTAYLAAAS